MLDNLKTLLKRMPIAGPFLMRYRQKHFRDSARYWELRYVSGGTSGAGSSGRLARFKADFLNEFVSQNGIQSVVEWGCGDGSQLELAQYPTYLGVDISAKAVEMCAARFAKDQSKVFKVASEVPQGRLAECSISLDVIYHLVEDSVFERYMRNLFASASRYVIVYSSDVERETMSMHVRNRCFTNWIKQNEPGWYLQKFVKNAYPFDPSDAENTSISDFFVFAPRDLEFSSIKPD